MRTPERSRGIAYPDFEQAVAFHAALVQRLGVTDWGPINESKLRSALERAKMSVEQRGDLIAAAAFLLFGLVRDQPFGKGSVEAGLALTLAFLLRHGCAIEAPDEEIAGLSLAVADGEAYAGIVEQWMREYAAPARQ